MPLKLKLPGGDSKRTKTSQSNASSKTSSSNSSERKLPPPKPQRHQSWTVESATAESPPGADYDDYPSVFDGGPNNNCSPLGSPQSAPESCGTAQTPLKHEQRRRPKSVSAPLHPEEVGVRSKEPKPGRNRAFSVSRSGKFKEAKRRTSLLEIQDRFDKAAKDEGDGGGGLGSSDVHDKS